MLARRPSALLLGAALAAVALTACGDGGGTAASRISADPSAAGEALPTDGGSGEVVIASANFPENQILAEVYQQALAGAGYDASVKPLTTRPNILPAVESDDIQVEPDYVGSLTEFLNKDKNGPDAPMVASGDLDATYAKAQELAAEKGLTVLEPSPAQDQNAFAVTREFSEKNDVTKLSDLSDFDGPLVLGGTPECKTYSLCQPGLEKTYGITFTGFEQTDLGGTLSVSKLKSGTVQIGEFLSSDGGVKANDFVVLEDDKMLQAVDNIVPVISKSVAGDELLRDILERVSAAMTTEDLIALNASVSIDRKLPAQAATDFLVGKGLIAS
jgi:osmoprotectant transport system substrate-binding protein